MQNSITPQAAIIELNRIRTPNDTRSAAIDLAIRAINRCMVKQRPNREGFYGSYCCPKCHNTVGIISNEHCGSCGQKLDWRDCK